MQRLLPGLLYLLFSAVSSVESFQQWHAETMHNWRVDLDQNWDVLGPFPISAREQHFLSPSFPLDLSRLPYQHEPNRTWPSSLSDNGTVTWKSLESDGNRLLVSHSDIRWNSIRATEGWAALQHHNLLRSTLKITPPSDESIHPFPWLSFSVKQASFFTLIPYHSLPEEYPEWHSGNIYAFPVAPKQLIKPPQLSTTTPTYYHLFVSGDFEIRLFGDPLVNNHHDPTLDITIDVSIQSIGKPAVLDPHLDVIPDLWQGWFFGSTIGIAVCILEAEWTITDVKSSLPALKVSLHHNQRISSPQTRVVPIVVDQVEPVRDETFHIEVVLKDNSTRRTLTLVSHINLHHWTDHSSSLAIKATYLLGGSPTYYLAIPPTSLQSVKSPIIAIHGAGVEITDPFWAAALPRQLHSWIVCPSGRTSWGLDWHGLSADDVWGSLAALKGLLETRPVWDQLTIGAGFRPILVGHSNGGQGTWYLTARYPDKIQAAVPAAAYIKSQQYIPLSLSRGTHFLDASRNAVLLSALTPDDNDLFMSNVINTPILAIHGGADENVPVWHSRELVSLVKSWKADAPISLHEEPNQPHWYPTVFSSRRFLDFLDATLFDNDISTKNIPYSQSHPFTLTVADPKFSGSLQGVSIQEVAVPGRLARVHVIPSRDAVMIETENVYMFTLDRNRFDTRLCVDGTFINIGSSVQDDIWIRRRNDTWMVSNPPIGSARPMGPIPNILSSATPLTIVTPAANAKTESVARRIAHTLFQYFRLDVSLISDTEAMKEKSIDSNIIILGADNRFGLEILGKGPGLIQIFPNDSIMFREKKFKFSQSSTGMLFLHPNPSSSISLVLFLVGTDEAALERAARVLLPIRTGVPLPEFLVFGQHMDTQATGGLRGAGFWNRNWDWSEEMAWLH